MGSLMAGWDSPVLGKTQELRRSSSNTNEQVEKFWRTKKMIMEEHLREATAQQLAQGLAENNQTEAANTVNIPGATLPNSKTEAVFSPSSGDWWTRSSWAFLNDPPRELLPGEESRYASQFDVATRPGQNRASFNRH